MFGGCNGIAIRRIHHHHTTLGGSGDIHIIDTDTSAPDNFQIVSSGENRLGDLDGRADWEPVIRPNDGLQFFC